MSTVATDRPLLSVAQVAERLNVSVMTTRRLIAAGELPALRVGAQLRVDHAALEGFLRAAQPQLEPR